MTVNFRRHLSLLHELLESGDDTHVEADLQCPNCRRTVCRATDLCFFVRQSGFRGFGGAAYLVLKPEMQRPSGIREVASKCFAGSIMSWECECRCYLGDTRRIFLDPTVVSDVGGRLRFASRPSLPMITFNPTAVILCGHKHRGSDLFSWLPIYLMQRYRHIEVRDRERMLPFIDDGAVDACSSSSLCFLKSRRNLWLKWKMITRKMQSVAKNDRSGCGRRRKNRRE